MSDRGTPEDKLRAFAREILNEWWDLSSMDGGDLQAIAERHGLLEPHQVTEPCGEACGCAEMGDFPMTCYRMTPALTGELPALAPKTYKQRREDVNQTKPGDRWVNRKSGRVVTVTHVDGSNLMLRHENGRITKKWASYLASSHTLQVTA